MIYLRLDFHEVPIRWMLSWVFELHIYVDWWLLLGEMLEVLVDEMVEQL